MIRRWFAVFVVLAFSSVLCLGQSNGAGVRAGEEKGVARDPAAGHGLESGTDPQGTGVNTGKSTGKASAADRTFMNKAAQGGLAEVELGQLAQQNGQSQDVKDFGKKMVDDHTKANDQLKQVAAQEGMTLPSDLDAKDKATKDRLSQLHGEAFDKAYMKDMVTDHKKDVAEFKRESDSGTNPEVKQFATQALPTLQDHLKMAEQVDEKVGGAASTGPKAAGNSASSQPKQ